MINKCKLFINKYVDIIITSYKTRKDLFRTIIDKSGSFWDPKLYCVGTYLLNSVEMCFTQIDNLVSDMYNY